VVSRGLTWSHQRRHGEADDLDEAVVVALRFKLLVVSGVTPRRGAGAVPAAHESG